MSKAERFIIKVVFFAALFTVGVVFHAQILGVAK